MRKIISIVLMLAMLPFLSGCQPTEASARDAIAAATGAIQSAQTEYKDECSALPSAPKCVLINQAVYAQNASITALEAFCGFQVNVSLPSDTCKPVASAQGALNAALANIKNFTGEILAILAVNKPATKANAFNAVDRAHNIAASIVSSTPKNPTFADMERVRVREGM